MMMMMIELKYEMIMMMMSVHCVSTDGEMVGSSEQYVPVLSDIKRLHHPPPALGKVPKSTRTKTLHINVILTA